MRELVGQGKPFYSSLDKAAGLLRRKVGTGSEFLKELMSIPGVKQAEIAERGLGELLNAPKMTHEQFMAALSAKPAPAIHERMLGDTPSQKNIIRGENAMARHSASNYAESAETSQEAREMRAEELRRLRANHRPQMQEAARRDIEGDDATWHGQYTLPGGENYREMLIKAPLPKTIKDAKEWFHGVPQHFGGQSGILASMRLKDRTGPNGEKLLHLEELQSDWHQQGREKGYHDPEKLANAEKTIQALKAEHKRLGEVKAQAATPEEREAISEQRLAIMGQIRDATILPFDHVPDAPFKKNWEEMALKRLIHHAAEKGYHGVVVTPGAEQADRYGLAKHVGMVSYHPGEKRFQAFKPNRETVVNEKDASPDRVAELIGKEAAQRLLAAPKVGDHHFLEGEDLNIGGEGMKGFYDKKVPNILNGIGKKYGVKTELGGHKLPGDPSQRGDASERLGLAGERLADMNPEQVQAFNQKLDDANAKQLHYFPITEAMRQDVKKNGIPLYKSGGTVSTH